MGYNPFSPEKDFVRRTIQLAESFSSHEFCTTLQINLFFGTVMLPKSHWYNDLDSFHFSSEQIKGVSIHYANETVSLKILLHCLRNGIAHWREKGNQNIKFITNNDNAISKVTINGTGNVNRNTETIKIEFNLEDNGILNFMKAIFDCLK